MPANSTISPGYDQVAREIAARIDRGEYPAGQRLPSILSLASEYGVAAVTVRRAIGQLCQAGRLQTLPGVGTFATAGGALSTVTLVMSRNALPATQFRLVRLDVIDGATSACAQVGARLNIATDVEDPEEFIGPRNGIILCSDDIWPPSFARWAQMLIQKRAAWTSVGYDHDLPNFITRDMRAALRTGLRHLYALGHRRVAVLGRQLASGQPLFPEASVEDMPGLTVTQRSESMAVNALGGENVAVVGRVLGPIMDSERPTALFVGTDGFAAAALEWLTQAGLRVPQDISVLSFSRRAFSAWRGMALTRVNNPQEEIGRRAVEELSKAAAGGGYRIGRVEVSPELVEGMSCAPLDAGRA